MGGGVPQMVTFLSQLKMMHAFEQINGILLGTFSQMERDQLTPDMPQLVRQAAGPDLPIAKTPYILSLIHIYGYPKSSSLRITSKFSG